MFYLVHSLDTLEAFQWLKNNSEPFTEVIEKWKITKVKRDEEFPSTILEYFGLYPGLRHPLGYLLLEEDFKITHRGKENHLINKWPQLSNILLKIARTRQDQYVTEIIQRHEEKQIYDGEF